MRRFLPLLIGVIVTPLSAAAHHETMLAHVVDEGDTNLPVSRGRVDTGSTEQIYLMLKDGGSFSVPIPMTNRFTCDGGQEVGRDAHQGRRRALKGVLVCGWDEAKRLTWGEGTKPKIKQTPRVT